MMPAHALVWSHLLGLAGAEIVGANDSDGGDGDGNDDDDDDDDGGAYRRGLTQEQGPVGLAPSLSSLSRHPEPPSRHFQLRRQRGLRRQQPQTLGPPPSSPERL